MNRKQKIAIVVGAVVIALLALFPPWSAMKVATTEVRTAPLTHTQYAVQYQAHAFDGFRWIACTGTRTGEGTVDTKPDYPAAISLQLAALALTVAGVVVLKERKVAS